MRLYKFLMDTHEALKGGADGTAFEVDSTLEYHRLKWKVKCWPGLQPVYPGFKTRVWTDSCDNTQMTAIVREVDRRPLKARFESTFLCTVISPDECSPMVPVLVHVDELVALAGGSGVRILPVGPDFHWMYGKDNAYVDQLDTIVCKSFERYRRFKERRQE